jgi:hypothetical protein
VKRLATLQGYLQSQRKEIAAILSAIKTTHPESEEKTVYLGYMLHNLYCALEDLFKQVADTFENSVDDLSRYHRDLLRRMSFDVPGVRPQLLSDTTYKTFDELRRFRHLFRHAYTYTLDPHKVEDLQAKILNSWNSAEEDLDQFTRFLAAAGTTGNKE